MKNHTTTERKSERELVVTRTFDAPARIVFEAWTRPELFCHCHTMTLMSDEHMSDWRSASTQPPTWSSPRNPASCASSCTLP